MFSADMGIYYTLEQKLDTDYGPGLDYLVQFGTVPLLMATTCKLVPDANIEWKDLLRSLQMFVELSTAVSKCGRVFFA
jgi:hypothetical protein